MRINRKGLILGSKPCDNCNKLLDAVGLTNIYYSNDSGNFNDTFGSTVYSGELTSSLAMV